MACGWLYAYLTDRLLFIDYPYLDYHDFPMDVNWVKYKENYKQSYTLHEYYVDNWDDIMTMDLGAINEDLIKVGTMDYICTPIWLNPLYKEKLANLFPDYEMFHTISKRLFNWKDNIRNALNTAYDYLFKNQKDLFILGVQIRLMKGMHATLPSIESYCHVAKAVLAKKHPEKSVIFLASDTSHARQQFASCIDGYKVVYIDYNSIDLDLPQDKITAVTSNPGTDASGLIDFLLLTKCHDLVITFASSYGAVAGGISGVIPYYVMPKPDYLATEQVSFFHSYTSEPCYYRGKAIFHRGSQAAKSRWLTHPHYMHHTQCHFL
jgi:hypothetical protein